MIGSSLIWTTVVLLFMWTSMTYVTTTDNVWMTSYTLHTGRRVEPRLYDHFTSGIENIQMCSIRYRVLLYNDITSSFNAVFLKEDFTRKSTKTILLTKYIHRCTSHHQLHIQTPYIIQDVVFTMVKRHLSNGQLSRKVVQLIYVGCPRLMQIY